MMNRQNRLGSQSSSQNIMSSSLPASGFQREFAKKNSTNSTTPSSDLTFEKRNLSKLTTPMDDKQSTEGTTPFTIQSSRRKVAKKRNLNLDGSLFWEILSESKQYLHSCTNAQKTICIPPDDEVNYVINTLKYTGAKFQAFMKDHILSNSPLFIGEYITDRGNHIYENSELYENLARQKKKNVSLASLGVGFNSTTDENSVDDFVNVLQTGKGFNRSFNIFVLKEETCYNEKYQPYKVLFVDKCIADEHQQISIGALNDQNDEFCSDSSEVAKWKDKRPTAVEEYHQFLQDVNYKAYNDKLKRSIQHFNFNYLLLRGFHSSIPDKIMEYYQVIYGEFQTVSLLPEDDKDVKNAIHCVLLEGIYDKLFPFLEKYAYQSEDQKFLQICMSINAACSKMEEEDAAYDLFDILSIGNSFRCDQMEAITHLTENINLSRNPFDKMKCIKKTIDKIVNSISKFNQANIKTEFVTTDDMIPLLSYVLVRAQIPNMITNFNYMQDYQLEEEHGVSEYGFSVVTLNATIYYLKEEIYGKDENKWKKYRKLVETPKKSPSQSSLKKLDIEPFLNSPVSPLVDFPPNSTTTTTTTTTVENIESKPKLSRSFVSFDGNVDSSVTDNLHSNTDDDQLSGLLSPRDTQRTLALKQKRQQEREKRMSIRKLESIAVIKSFVSSNNSSPPNINNGGTSLSRQNSMPYGLPSRNRNNNNNF